ncbi:MAG: zinc ribbon domain-containing protein [Haloferacaceae archaeon]
MERRAAVAAVVGAVGAAVGIAGAGHVYLRRWRRAAAWFSVALGASVVLVFVFADPQTVTADSLPPEVVAPVAAVLVASVADAYLAGRQGQSSRAAGDDAPDCPACGRDLDPTLEFCWYCSAPIEGGVEEDGEPTSR